MAQQQSSIDYADLDSLRARIKVLQDELDLKVGEHLARLGSYIAGKPATARRKPGGRKRGATQSAGAAK